jgi:hypothetical protein
MNVFSFMQKCRVINEFAANLPFKIGMKTANSNQKYRLAGLVKLQWLQNM